MTKPLQKSQNLLVRKSQDLKWGGSEKRKVQLGWSRCNNINTTTTATATLCSIVDAYETNWTKKWWTVSQSRVPPNRPLCPERYFMPPLIWKGWIVRAIWIGIKASWHPIGRLTTITGIMNTENWEPLSGESKDPPNSGRSNWPHTNPKKLNALSSEIN